MIVVDASVAVKWTVAEPLHHEALSLTRGDFSLVAPNLIVIETLNVLRRKLKRGEIHAAQLDKAAEEIPKVFDLLVPESSLSERIVKLASALDHSVYDCAYLACAIEFDAPLVTADSHFARKLQALGFPSTVLELAPGIDGALIARQQQVSIERQAVHLWQLFDQTVSHVRNSLAAPSATFQFFSSADFRPAFESPSYMRLSRFVRKLTKKEKARLLALSWYGRAHVHESWEKILATADKHVDLRDSTLEAYIISTFVTLAVGLEKLQANVPDSLSAPS